MGTVKSKNNFMSHLPTSESILGRHDGGCWVWHLKRNISIAPSHLAFVFMALGIISLLIGLGFYWVGASFVLPFSFVEIAVLVIAYFYNAIHANDYEKLIVDGNSIKIESKIGFKITQTQLVRSLTRVDTLRHMNEIIHLRQGVKYSYFGKFVHANLRPLLAKKISERLHLR
ncbi:DUF2244 domain-containing protein [Limnohabitans sp. B9-3]|uniref:DUF2244 domain-containing protein n=1 Tax=Limnohabitans sp. B9-3 TaxID=1100707 RepID=UPI0013044C97|nr:DUF2244 domain-containing protein [Limnohabitans sp. B9-3]